MMNKESVASLLDPYMKSLPQFPDGRINYGNALEAPVITCFIQYGDEFLLLKRSMSVRSFKGHWNTVAGYVDQVKPLKDIVLKELREELNIEEEAIQELKQGEQFRFRGEGTTWIVHPHLVVLRERPKVLLNWEHTEFAWVTRDDLQQYALVPNTIEALQRVC